MSQIWNAFIHEFCKVEFICYNGDPNWLGWLFIGFAGLFIGGFIVLIIGAIIVGIITVIGDIIRGIKNRFI